jgi:predicted NodU family carbamoyl transferase
MYIVGLNAYHGDAAAALIKDGCLVAAVEEERFNRVTPASSGCWLGPIAGSGGDCLH